MNPHAEFGKQFRGLLEITVLKPTPSSVSRPLKDIDARTWCDLVHTHLIANNWVSTSSLTYAALVSVFNKIPGKASYERRVRAIIKINPWTIDANAFWKMFLARLDKDSTRQGQLDGRTYTETEHIRFCGNLFEEIHGGRISYWELCDIFLTIQGQLFACNQDLVDAIMPQLQAIISAA